MSSKRKWDQPAQAEDGGSSKAARTEESKSASDAAAAAAAIAAKIAAQFASGPSAASLGTGTAGPRDLHDAEFTYDIDINDVRNRYLLTKGSTQDQIHEETGASVGTKGVWYPDRSKATEKDPPLYLHLSAHTKESLEAAINKVNELIAIDMGSLVENKSDRLRERRKWPEEKLPVGLESIRNFNVRAKVVGPQGSFVKYIQAETSTRVQIKGIGSGFVDQETGQEEPTPLYIHITGPEEGQVARAKVLTEDLLLVVRQEHAKVQTIVQQQQMELHRAQAQYAAYSALGGYAPPPPEGAPPPPPGEAPPPPPGGTPAADAAKYAAGPPAATDTDAYAAYWAAYGYDVNSPEFKEWQASQQQQYAQYYASQGYDPAAYGAAAGAPQPNEAAPPPPPPP
ncbi:putative K homology RNA-binding domain containing protein [Lyophyllum shimeji]|uniref:K homology RNA-binding domain containing protein n=1 Tax=Lyophyllum shimeji TaxID=47721 RepID=A0A9P3PNV7_LYOSH|nr:putative K homology RNA-binding domain containing protein [Lyophyllum shimeji]